MHRLFVAIDLPETHKNRLAGILQGVPGARWLPLDQLHITLRFIGEVDDQLFNAAKESLRAIQAPPFAMKVKGTGCFPSPVRPRVLWAGLEVPAALISLQRSVEQALSLAGIPPEERSFSPHITLARLREPRRAEVSAFLALHGRLESDPFPVEEFHLYSSTLTRDGAIHRREQSYTLTAPQE